NCDCGRFCEIWSLVFTQYNQDESGRRIPLPKANIDTGMGLERALAAIEGKSSPYETGLLSPVVDAVCRVSGKKYGTDHDTDRAIRIVAEHSRAIAFLIADGVMPSNEGRGYVLRRILRRASLFGRKLGLNGSFLNEIADVVVGTMSHIYPELIANQGLISEVIKVEEEKFIATLDTGLNLVEKLIGEVSTQGRVGLTGEEVFRLCDTYGFPPELTAEIAREKGLSIDWEGFRAEMEKQRERARGVVVKPRPATAVATTQGPTVVISVNVTSTNFVGYRKYGSRSRVRNLITEGSSLRSVSEAGEVDVMLNKTPFYGEMGGQVGDTGEISSKKGKIAITNTLRTPSDVIIHRGKVVEGSISIGDEVEAKVDVARRLDIARNHTATHLLHAALKQIIDRHIEQKGSLVEPEKFRFDFSYLGQVTEEQLNEIQRQVNEWIRRDLKAEANVLP
ncbi:MAG: alanine--tRNA ligase, partial [Dehalococcoidia bacterium]|nr:alanine--tRNA ligase [Dehalococcoidia bacterium]